jgi:hypothetical protein
MVTQRFDDDFPFENESSGGDAQRDDTEQLERDRESGDREARRARKERVLHTRISEQLSEDIRRAADDLRVPVSNLVRNVLEETFGAVERVTDEVGAFLEEALSDADGARNDLRRIGRRFQALARRQRRRFARDFEGVDEADADEVEAFEPAAGTDRGEPRPAPPAPPEPPRPAADAPRRETGTEPPAAPSFPDVIGWQPLLANTAGACAACARPIAAGERTFAGATERGLSRTFLCTACMRARSGS